MSPPSVARASRSADLLLQFAERMTSACPAPAVLVDAGGRVRLVNPPAASLLGLGDDLAGGSARSLFGLGWRELELIAREGDADLLTEVPGHSERRGMRVRLEAVAAERGEVDAVIAFLELAEAPTSRRQRRARAGGFDALFGHDPTLEAIKEAAARFAGTLLPILLLAETGTGKELLARAIHGAGPRRDQPFVAINCGALSPHLLESELFGYAPGAFTGASRQGHDGKVGAARGGTLFLDEVAEMPGPLQSLLLRVLEDGTYYRVGESVPRQADVRLVCATCRDLPRLVAEGGFRQDLYYRIDGACLTLPTVRTRRDVPELIRHLLDELAREDGLASTPTIKAEAFERMMRYPWPGNVRQLKTALRHGMILSAGRPLGLEHLPAEVAGREVSRRELSAEPAERPEATESPESAQVADHTGDTGATSATDASDLSQRFESQRFESQRFESQRFEERRSEPSTGPGVTARLTLLELEAQRLQRAVESSGGNLTLAARQLGIARTTLYRRLRKHGFLPTEDGP